MRRQTLDHQSRVFNELAALVLTIFRSPPSRIDFSDAAPVVSPGVVPSPSGFASLLLGISLALMLCGSVSFFVGFILMPWVVMVFSVAGIVSAISMLGRFILCSSPENEISAWKLS